LGGLYHLYVSIERYHDSVGIAGVGITGVGIAGASPDVDGQ